jgi:hypothetical protein
MPLHSKDRESKTRRLARANLQVGDGVIHRGPGFAKGGTWRVKHVYPNGKVDLARTGQREWLMAVSVFRLELASVCVGCDRRLTEGGAYCSKCCK